MSEQMTIHECEAKAKNEGFDTATFDLCGIGGRMKCRWLDAYFGLLQVEGRDGFLMTKAIAEMPLWCENFASGKD